MFLWTRKSVLCKYRVYSYSKEQERRKRCAVMWIQTNEANQLTLVLEGSGALSKEDIHISVRFTQSGKIRWKYLHHQPYQRPIPNMDWRAEEPIVRSVLSRALFQEIQSRLADELASLLLHIETDEQPDSYRDLPNFDRRSMLLLMLSGRISRMTTPSTEPVYKHKENSPAIGIGQSVAAIRSASGMSVRQFAQAANTNFQTIHHLESCKHSAAPSTLRSIALLGRRYMEWKAATFLEEHALVAEGHVRHKGGHR